jgi:3-hydroxyisobutyrate dehydrogenase-like beta-hydroxyacid dehydrogenase
MRIGFVGAGLMGHGMVLGLLKAGHQVSVIAHRNRAPIDDLVSKGAIEASDIRAIAHESDCIMLCLSSSRIVGETIAALKPHLRASQIIIDTGTTEPGTTRQIALELENLGISYTDAPVTGGPEQAEKSDLGVLCGASAETYAKIKPILSCIASTVRHLGPVGSGQTAKLISNYLVTGMIALVAETFSAARESRIDWGNLYEAMLNGSGNSGVLRKMVEPALLGNFDGYKFALENAAKDIRYFNQLGYKTPMSTAIEDIFVKAVADGLGKQNVSQILNS